MKTVAVSGGFDPVHPGHLRMFDEAMLLAGTGGTVLVILNNDNWLKKKKGYVFMDEDERREVLLSLYSVDEVVISLHEPDPEDMSVAPELRMYKPDIFLNAGDRSQKNTPETEVCKELGIELAFVNVGYRNHSSTLLQAAAQNGGWVKRPWGMYKVHSQDEEREFTLKTLHFNPGEETSLQSHDWRAEYWFLIDGQATVDVGESQFEMVPWTSYVIVGPRAKHRIKAGLVGAVLVEVIRGQYDEEDVIRYEDKYGRA